MNQAQKKTIGEDIAYVQFKWPIGKPRVDYLRDSVWEVRSRLDNRIARVLFAVDFSQMILLHGFIKKTKQCKKCMCFMNLKCALVFAFCPENKWEAYKEEEVK